MTDRVRVGLQVIQSELQQLNALASKVSAASNEQSQGVGLINRAVTELDSVTQGTAGSAEESAAAALDLRSYSEQLERAIHGLVELLDGAGKRIADGPGPVPQPPASLARAKGRPGRPGRVPPARSREVQLVRN